MKHFDVMLDSLVLKIEVVGQLIHVAGTDPNLLEYPSPVLASPCAPQKEPKQASELRVVLHCSLFSSSLFIHWTSLIELEQIWTKS